MPEYRFFYLKKDGHVAGSPATYELPNDGVAAFPWYFGKEIVAFLAQENAELCKGF